MIDLKMSKHGVCASMKMSNMDPSLYTGYEILAEFERFLQLISVYENVDICIQKESSVRQAVRQASDVTFSTTINVLDQTNMNTSLTPISGSVTDTFTVSEIPNGFNRF